MTWANIALLRFLGSTLPVEVWHLPGEMTGAAAELLRLVGAKTRLLRTRTRGYWTMPFAIAETGFQHVLHLGSDLTPFANLDRVLDNELYLQHGAFLTPDTGDVRTREWFPSAWTRLGLQPPKCLGKTRCFAAWESDGSIMALDRARCPTSGMLRALAADGSETNRYGREGDKELYRLAWEAVGCTVAYMPYPGVAGIKLPSYQDKDSLLFWGLALLHRSQAGALLGIHWAWGKTTLHSYMPHLPILQSPPPGGYAQTAVDAFTVPEHVDIAPGGDRFSWSVRLNVCYDLEGEVAPCEEQALNITEWLRVFNDLLIFGRKAFHDCPSTREFGDDCPLRARLGPKLRSQALERLTTLRARAALVKDSSWL